MQCINLYIFKNKKTPFSNETGVFFYIINWILSGKNQMVSL